VHGCRPTSSWRRAWHQPQHLGARDVSSAVRVRSGGFAQKPDLALSEHAQSTDCRIAGGETGMDGAAASSSRTHVAADCRGPLPNRCVATSEGRRPRVLASGPGARASSQRRLITEPRSMTSRDGVAHEAPLSKVWRDPRSARDRCEPHASTRARLEVGAPVARQPTSPPAK
jgi:hypothetical protein